MITLVYSYYDAPRMIERHLGEWDDYPLAVKERLRAIIVDDGSERFPAAGEIFEVGFEVELYRIKQNIAWNFHGARNLGMHAAPDGWCFILDIDHLIESDQAERLVEAELDSGSFYRPARRLADGNAYKQHPDATLLEKSLYWRVGGSDEDYSGYYAPGDLFVRNIMLTAQEKPLGVALTLMLDGDVPDAQVRDWGRLGSSYDWRCHPKLARKWQSQPYMPKNPLRFEWERVH